MKEKEMVSIKILEAENIRYASTFVFLAKAFISKYGEEAKEIIKKARYNYGYHEGQILAKMAKEKNLKEYIDLWMWQFDPTLERMEIVEKNDKKFLFKVHRCVHYETWKKFGFNQEELHMLGDIFCVYDFGVADGYNPKLNLRRAKWLPKGDMYCEFKFKLQV